MYPVLEGELRKNKITREILANKMNLSIPTVSEKLNKKDRIKLHEAVYIKEFLHTPLSIEELFATEEELKKPN